MARLRCPRCFTNYNSDEGHTCEAVSPQLTPLGMPSISPIESDVAKSGSGPMPPVSSSMADAILKDAAGNFKASIAAGIEREVESGVTFDSGAKRSGRKAPLFLVPKELLEEVAWARYEGDSKYKPGNWMQGNKEFFIDCLDHAI